MGRTVIYAYPYKFYTDGLPEFCLVYDKEENMYSFEIETILIFDDENGQKIHITSILSDFTEWMKETGHDIETPIDIWEYFDTEGLKQKYISVEKAYTAFKAMANGFLNYLMPLS